MTYCYTHLKLSIMAALYLLFIFLVLLKSYFAKGSSYCMVNCDSNGHQPSLYFQYC